MKEASIDIGTNSVLLLVAEKRDGRLTILDEKQEIPRLGKGVDREKNLHPDSRKRVLSVLQFYKEWLMKNYPVVIDRVRLTATSAVRDASNRKEFIREIHTITGWPVQLLDGKEEAETTYRGALSVLHDVKGMYNLVLDIGGGSSEIAAGRGFTFDEGISFDMGSVRFSERFFSGDPPPAEDIMNTRVAVQAFLNGKKVPGENFRAIGVAGTVTSLAGIESGLKHYNSKKLNGYRLGKLSIEKLVKEFSIKSAYEIEKKYPTHLKGRGDVILAGTLILNEFLEWCGKSEIIVSTGGIRHGILFQ
ncbi:MAG: Ppx/GppA family phosphatase [Balneolaceae bacterium]